MAQEVGPSDPEAVSEGGKSRDLTSLGGEPPALPAWPRDHPHPALSG